MALNTGHPHPRDALQASELEATKCFEGLVLTGTSVSPSTSFSVESGTERILVCSLTWGVATLTSPSKRALLEEW